MFLIINQKCFVAPQKFMVYELPIYAGTVKQ